MKKLTLVLSIFISIQSWGKLPNIDNIKEIINKLSGPLAHQYAVKSSEQLLAAAKRANDLFLKSLAKRYPKLMKPKLEGFHLYADLTKLPDFNGHIPWPIEIYNVRNEFLDLYRMRQIDHILATFSVAPFTIKMFDFYELFRLKEMFGEKDFRLVMQGIRTIMDYKTHLMLRSLLLPNRHLHDAAIFYIILLRNQHKFYDMGLISEDAVKATREVLELRLKSTERLKVISPENKNLFPFKYISSVEHFDVLLGRLTPKKLIKKLNKKDGKSEKLKRKKRKDKAEEEEEKEADFCNYCHG